MDFIKLRKKIAKWCRKLRDRGAQDNNVATEMLRQGLTLLRGENGERIERAIVSLTDNNGVSIETPMPGHRIAIVPTLETRVGASQDRAALIRETAELLDGYAQHHLAKTPPDIDKAARNVRQAKALYGSIGVPYNPPEIPSESPQDAARAAQEADLLPGTTERPYKGSDAPLDRRELLAWIDMKLDGCARHGMREASDVLQAFRGEIAQHLEAAPIDYAVALRSFYEHVYAGNVKAGWWSDLSNGEPKKRNVGELFILFVTELAEAYDAYLTREPDDKLPQYPGLGVELGDLQIRLADFCGALMAGNIIESTDTRNPGDAMFREISDIAARYERIRKTPEARGDKEAGVEFLAPADVGEMVVAKLVFNATREDHKVENRKKEGGKQT